MEIRLVSDDEQVRELLRFQLTSQLPVEVVGCDSKTSIELLKKGGKPCDLFIMPYDGPGSVHLQALRDQRSLPFVLYYDPALTKLDPKAVEGLACLGIVEISNLVAGTIAVAKDFLGKKGALPDLPGFCPIKTALLIRLTPLKSDIYIRLSVERHIKLFKSGDEFTKADLAKYCEKKGIEYMYLRRSEAGEFISKLSQELDGLLGKAGLKPEDAQRAVEETQETIQNLIENVGFTPQVQELAKKNVQLVMKNVGNNPKLSSLLDRVKRDENYLSHHSSLLAEVSCCLAKEMEWGSESSFAKLVLASLMHDIALKEPKLAQVTSLKELDDRKAEFSAESAKSYNLHPMKSADVVRAFQEIPPDVDIIVMQHHERPGGGGFPRGLAHNHIAPLAVLFIVAHDLVHEILRKGDKFSLSAFIEEKKQFYNVGNFRKVMTALAKLQI